MTRPARTPSTYLRGSRLVQVRDGDPAFAASDRHTRRFMGLEPASHSLRSRQETPLQLWRRSQPGARADDNRDMRPRRRGVSQSDGMFGAGRRRPASRRFTKRANMCADHARTFDPSGPTTPYRERCELVPTTLVLTRAQAPYRKPFRAAYAPHRSRAVAPCKQFTKRSPAAHTDPHRGPALTFTVTTGAREETCALPRPDTRTNRCVRASRHEMSPVSAVSLTRDGSCIRRKRCMSLHASYFSAASQRLTAPVVHNPDHRPRQSLRSPQRHLQFKLSSPKRRSRTYYQFISHSWVRRFHKAPAPSIFLGRRRLISLSSYPRLNASPPIRHHRPIYNPLNYTKRRTTE